MWTVVDKGLEEVGYLLTQSFCDWWGLYALAWPVGQTRFVIHKMDLKDCHAVISAMRVSHFFWMMFRRLLLSLQRMELHGSYRGYNKSERGFHI